MAKEPKVDVSPYNFVPLEEPPLRGAYPGVDRVSADGYSGALVCELEVVTAIFTADHRTVEKVETGEGERQHEESKRGKKKKDEKNRSLFHFLRDSYVPAGRPILQGTSLRGMVRSIYEAATNSCLPLAAVSGVSKKAGDDLGYQFDGLGEHEACTSSSELCPACRLFGIIHGEELHVRGRVTFSDATLSEGELQQKRIALAELSSPKPHHSGIYGKHGSKGRPIAGRKLYFHYAPGLAEPPIRSDRANDISEHAPPRTRFKFTVGFQNLSLNELAKLRHCLVLDEGLAHKFGMAKPLGFGSCTISLIDAECAVYRGGNRYERWRASSMNSAELDLEDDPFPDSLKEILRFNKHTGQRVGYLGWHDYRSAGIDQNGHYILNHDDSPRDLIGGSKGSGLTSTLAAIAQVSTEKPGKTEPKIRVNQKIKVEVTADDGGEYVLRVKETGQEGVRLRPGTRWKVGETQKVRVLALDSEGRVTKVTT